MASQSVGNDDQYSRTCSEVSGGGGGKAGFMLFGVRVVEGSFIRKSASTNNLAQYEQAQDSNSTHDVATAGYVSDDVVHRSRHRKRGVAWSEVEHKLFLLGLQKVGKGDWRGISRNFVKTRTPTQVASHAQKYFLRRNNHMNRRRRRSSLFDITTDAVLSSTIEDQFHLQTPPFLPQENVTKHLDKFPISPSSPLSIKHLIVPIEKRSIENLSLLQLNNSPRPLMPIPILPLPPSSKMGKLDLNKENNTLDQPPSLSLNLFTPAPFNQQSPSQTQSLPPQSGRRVAALEEMPASFNGSIGDSIISVA